MISSEILATDEDTGINGVIRYRLTSLTTNDTSYFIIDPNTGVITLNSTLDFEEKQYHEVIFIKFASTQSTNKCNLISNYLHC